MRILLQHRSRYEYPSPAALGPHMVRLRPATHAKATIETYSLRIEQPATIHWQQDPSGNRVARLAFKDGVRVSALDIAVELAVDIRPVNPFDFTLDDCAGKVPFEYPSEMRRDLLPFLDASEPAVSGGPLLDAFLAGLPRGGKTVELVIELNRLVSERVRYVIREEAGIWSAEETLAQGRGSCRDSAVLLIAALRSRGLAARFVSGYLIQLTDEGMIPGAPRGVRSDVVDLHAWAEVYLPGGGWVGLDATSGLFCGEGHIPLACTAYPPFASPIEGTSDVVASDVSFSMTVRRLGHEPRPTTPYEEDVWQALLAGGDSADARLAKLGVVLTMGGEPTFNARDHAAEPEWNSDALGETKWTLGLLLARELRKRLAPGAAILQRAGKLYPGESLPRWALELVSRRDGVAIWSDFDPNRATGPTSEPPRFAVPQTSPPGPLSATTSPSSPPSQKGDGEAKPNVEDARRVAQAIARRLHLSLTLQPAFEDPWRLLQEEASLPIDVDPMKANLDDDEDRRRLARALDRGLGREVGFVLPLARADKTWVSERWTFRRGHLFLVPGDSSIGLRLPLRSLSTRHTVVPIEEVVVPPDPRRAPDDEETASQRSVRFGVEEEPVPALVVVPAVPSVPPPATGRPGGATIRTALTVEAREGAVYVFLPPVECGEDFLELVAEIDAARHATGVDIQLEGYPPPASKLLQRFAVTPDPGVLEVNLPPTKGIREYATLVETVFEAALHSGLHAEKYTVDGRQAGSGGGNHLTFGGPTALESPFLRRPDILGSLITFFQHHPSLSYMFTGLFVGPTSQAPRVDEARHDALYELEIALRRAFELGSAAADPSADAPSPWLPDMLFRHMLVDVAGNTHRAEICIDKLFAPDAAHSRQGLVELRAFEMPPHHRMAVAQAILVRALISAFAVAPYAEPLCRFGQSLHDRYLLPYWMWRDFEDVLAFLESRGISLPAAAFRPFVDLRCPVVGELFAGDVRLEVRNAIEPWHVLGEEMTTTGTSRYVDSAVERIEVLASGLVPERHAVLVNGLVLPLRPTKVAGEHVGGVRFRAWAPPHSLHAHLGIHHPLRIDVLDTWGKRSLGACGYHVWHPEGRGYNKPPLTRFEASARRAQRFTVESPISWPVAPLAAAAHGDAPYTLDLRRYPGDRPPPPFEVEAEEDA